MRKKSAFSEASAVLGIEEPEKFLEGLRNLLSIPSNLQPQFQRKVASLQGRVYEEAQRILMMKKS